MPVPTEEQIEKWRSRWKKYPGLTDKIIKILKGNGPAENDEEGAHRMWQVNKILPKEDFEVYEGEGEDIYRSGVKTPVLDLRGIYAAHLDLRKVVLALAHLEGIDLSRSHLEGAVLWASDLEGADLWYSHLEGADLVWSHLEGAILCDSHLKGAHLRYSHLEGADLRWSHLEGADLSDASVGRLERLDYGCQLDKEKQENILKKKQITIFAHNDFLPRLRDLLKEFQMRKIKRLLYDRWFYTNFVNVRIGDADTVQAADLRRYVHDQQFLSRFRKRSPVFYKIWNITTNCGWSVSRVGILALIFISLFACLYGAFPLIDPEAYVKNYPSLSPIAKWFFVSFDIFTNLGIRNTHPQCDPGVIAVFLETVLGFSSLGLLISVFANKYARRA